ncbi:MAG TPA: hypothetical protein VFZ21_30655 [Gemmatimonadaceae bacterium]|nr:hypothetical protein [Gemmatimonadaceae bacterium]
MRVDTVFCSARDREVHVARTDEPLYEGQAPLPDAEFVCLEVAEPCGEAQCPLLAVPVEVLRFRLAHNGLDTSALRHVAARCAECGRTTELLGLDSSRVYCTECHAVGAQTA